MVCISVCEGMGVCLPERGPVSGRVGLCWDSQLLHGAVPGRAAGLVSVYWQPVCVSVCECVSLHRCVGLGVGPLLFGCSCSPPQLPSHGTVLPLNFAAKLHSSTEP